MGKDFDSSLRSNKPDEKKQSLIKKPANRGGFASVDKGTQNHKFSLNKTFDINNVNKKRPTKTPSCAGKQNQVQNYTDRAKLLFQKKSVLPSRLSGCNHSITNLSI